MFDKKPKLKTIPINKIYPNKTQPRKLFDQKEQDVLTESMRKNGLVTPITVRPIENGYQIVAGERRYRAMIQLKYTEVPAYVIETEPCKAMVMAFVENQHRQNLNPIETAMALEEMIKSYGITQQELANLLSVSPSAISNKMRILKLSAEEREITQKYNLTERHLRAILSLPEEIRLQAIIHCGKNQLSVSQTESYVKQKLSPRPKIKYVIKDLRVFVNTVNKAIDTMNKAGIGAKWEKSDTETHILYKILIPKKDKESKNVSRET